MEGKEWFNLRQICRNRFNNTHNDSKLSLSCCKRGVAMCCRRAGVVGIVGAVLVFLGMVQLGAGVYFMLVLPMFQLGSNIWTGAWCAICGAVVGAIAWKQQTMRKGQVILVASLSVLVAEVANLVIIQVGEYRVFLSDNDRRVIVEDNHDLTMLIAFWLTTIVTALGIVVSFFGAQYLFCVVVRGPRVKGRMPVTRSLSEEDLHHRQVQITRFQPPCLTTDTRVDSIDLAERPSSGNGSGHVHGFSDGGDGDGISSSQRRPRVVITNAGIGDGSSHQEQEASGSVESGVCVEETLKISEKKKQVPKTPEDNVPYFLRNHRSAWQFILPEVVRELRMSNRYSMTESFNDAQSRTSTLSRTSKSSFQPHRPDPLEHDNRPDLIYVNPQPSGQESEGLGAYRGAPSSCNTSLYSIPESCRKSGSKSPLGYRVVRPTVPPPAPPPAKSSAALRAKSAGGWESCAVLQYPAQAGGGFVVDLD